MAKAYHQIRELYREAGYYTGGLTTARTTFGDTVETHGRSETRAAVPSLPSDTGGVGVDNLYMTRSRIDTPTPGGTRAWIS